MLAVVAAVALVLVLNIPLGYWRGAMRKLSWQWFVVIHLSIPIAVGARLLFQVPWQYAPLFILTAIVGQTVGVRFRKRTGVRRVLAGAQAAA